VIEVPIVGGPVEIRGAIAIDCTTDGVLPRRLGRRPGGRSQMISCGRRWDRVPAFAWPSVRRATPGADQRLLQDILSVMKRPEHPVAMQVQLTAVRPDQLRKRHLVTFTGTPQQQRVGSRPGCLLGDHPCILAHQRLQAEVMYSRPWQRAVPVRRRSTRR